MQGAWSSETRKKHERNYELRYERDVERAKELYDTEASDTERYRFVEFVHLLMTRMNISQTYARKIAAMFERQYDTHLVRRKGLTRPPCTDEYRKHMSEIKKGQHYTWSDEARAKFGEMMRERQLGQKYTLSASGKKLGKAHLGDPNLQINIETYIPSKIINAEIEV